jgi:hypothetical protein
MPKPSTEHGRSHVAQSVGVAGIAGIAAGLEGRSGLLDKPGAVDVVLLNDGDEPVSGTLVVEHADPETFSATRRFDLAPGERIDPGTDTRLLTNGVYDISVGVDCATGQQGETFEWKPTVARAPLYVLVGDPENVTFLETVA